MCMYVWCMCVLYACFVVFLYILQFVFVKHVCLCVLNVCVGGGGGGGKKNGIETAQFQAVPFINFGLLFGEHPLVTTVSSRSKNSEKK